MPTILNPFKQYLYAAFVLAVIAIGGYIKYLQSEVAEEKLSKETYKEKLDEANTNNELIIQAYEKTLAIEREIAEQKTITSEKKEVVVTKYKTLTKTIEKRGEIKQDEKSNFTIVTF